jgi:acylphosphatase
MTAKLVLVSGRVQGVFYRAWTKEQADELGLRGWVRNRADGKVEALIAGDSGTVDRMIDRMHQGPPSAEVDEVTYLPADEPDCQDFTVRH